MLSTVRDNKLTDFIWLAQFAIDDENQKTKGKFKQLQLISLENVHVEPTEKSKIYYLSFLAKYCGEESSMGFRTAVRHPNEKNYPLESVGLIYVDEDGEDLLTSSDTEDQSPELQAAEVQPIAYRAVELHLGKSPLAFDPVPEVLHVSACVFPAYVKYCLTLLVDHSVYKTNVIKYKGDNFIESSGFHYLYDHPLPSSVTSDLIVKVRRMFHDEDLFWPELLPLFRGNTSIHRLSHTAIKFGEVMTRESLIPFLCNIKCLAVDDDVICGIAQELGTFLPYVGGEEYALVLLKPLEFLCSFEDVDIRNTAVESLCKIGKQVKQADFLLSFNSLVMRMASSRVIALRASSCGLFGVAYKNATNWKKDLMLCYGQLCKDGSTLVRRSAALSLTKIADTAKPSHLINYIIPMFVSLLNDGQEFVRLFSIKNCSTIELLLNPRDFTEHILHVVLNMSQDASLRVRYAVTDLLLNVGVTESTRVNLVSAYVCLLRDGEAVIGKAAAEKLSRFCSILKSKLVIEHILPCVKELSLDSAPSVRSSLASEVMEIAPVLGKDAAIEKLVPIIVSMLQDENSFVPLNVVTKHNQLNKVVGDNILSQPLFNATYRLSKDRNWRVRLTIAEYIPQLANPSNVDELTALCRHSLTDEDNFVCNAASKSLELLAQRKFGSVAMQMFHR